MAFLATSLCRLQVEIKGADNELKQVALDVLATKPNFAYTLEVRGEGHTGQEEREGHLGRRGGCRKGRGWRGHHQGDA